ncbi:MAG TPA: hypothetical protein VM733_16770 [Thermoanaerobaculia bacterium]|nr:hypothetical protein [Thermoanaerobaculia bacterium]
MVYQSNDDVILRLFAEAGSPFLLTINVIIGKLLAMLYAIAPGLPWYDVVMTGSLVVAAGVLAWAWGKRDHVWMIAFALVLLLPAFERMQFTVTAMLCACAGIALLLRDRPAFGAMLIVWGSLLRFEAAMLIILLALPFVKRRRIFIACAVAVALFGVNRLVYRMTPGWEDVYEINRLHVRISEYMPESRVTPELRERLRREVGWSANDLALFTDWFHALYPIGEARRAAAIVDTSPSLANAFESVRTFAVYLRWPLILIVMMWQRATGRRMLAVLAMLFALVFILGAFTKPPPPWISLPLVACAVTLLPEAPANRMRWVALAFAAIVAVRASRAVSVPAALPLPKGTFAVLHGGAYPYEANWLPFREARRKFAFVPIASSAHTPPVRRFGNIPLLLCTGDYAVLVAYPHVPRRLERYLEEHRGMRVHFDAVGPNVWRCREAPLPLLPPERRPSPAKAAGAASGG